jgi:hypothetical protein
MPAHNFRLPLTLPSLDVVSFPTTRPLPHQQHHQPTPRPRVAVNADIPGRRCIWVGTPQLDIQQQDGQSMGLADPPHGTPGSDSVQHMARATPCTRPRKGIRLHETMLGTFKENKSQLCHGYPGITTRTSRPCKPRKALDRPPLVWTDVFVGHAVLFDPSRIGYRGR